MVTAPRCFGALVAAALLATGCATDKKDPLAESTTVATVATSTAVSTTAASTTATGAGNAAPTSDAELEALLSRKVPAGFNQEPDSVGDTGPSDLAKAAKDEGSEDGGKELAKDGFVRGYQRLWSSPGEDELVLIVYQFATDAGATADFKRVSQFLRTSAPAGAKDFAIDGFAPANLMAFVATEDGSSGAITLGTVGVFMFSVQHRGSDAPALQANASAMMADQLQRLS